MVLGKHVTFNLTFACCNSYRTILEFSWKINRNSDNRIGFTLKSGVLSFSAANLKGNPQICSNI